MNVFNWAANYARRLRAFGPGLQAEPIPITMPEAWELAAYVAENQLVKRRPFEVLDSILEGKAMLFGFRLQVIE